jgi:spore germination cell wall hydrolase CwlJ-like protein
MKLKQIIAGAASAALTGAVVVGSFTVPVIASEVEKLYNAEQANCLALNIYYEARGSNLADKAGVADVALNRMYDTRYPNTICEVVQQGLKNADGSMKRNKCQFSWYCDGKSDNPQDQDRWNEAQMIAWQLLEYNKFRGITEGATHYHATYVNPRWAKNLQQVGRLGDHIFYRWEK